tara:strand:- start:28532 stop:32476 length:3945 start_codon:yes stop_codon:yes gene_type:complete
MKERRQPRRNMAKRSSWNPSKILYQQDLPICKRRLEIIAAVKTHPVIIISGETGSGKTTQIPKMCIDAGRGRIKRIACTQPRRVAALSIAKRVSEELDVEYGGEVGCKIRFADKTSPQTRIKFMTDGMLLAEIQSDPLMREYDTIIIDEAHERSLNIDFLLGHLNRLRTKRPDLKIIITSATIDTDKFSQIFENAPIIEVSGRVYPVDIIYAPLEELLDGEEEYTFLNGITESVDRIIEEFGHGDILAFLPTEKDIRETKRRLEGRLGNRCSVLPCYGQLSNTDQQQIFTQLPRRKIVLATNIAETSLTIPGIRFVIDTGLARISRYNPRARTKRLPIEKVSQSSANQRAGRCGRVRDGICIRLYSETDFIKRSEFSTPEIQRSNLAEVILKMMASRLGEIESFPFIDPPSIAAIRSGFALLEELGAIDSEHKLTNLGGKLAKIPVDPTAGRMLLQAEKEGVLEQILIITSALTIPDPRERPLGEEEQARIAQSEFIHKQSDFLTLLNIWEALHSGSDRISQSKLRKFCRSHYISYLRIREWKDVKDQLAQALRELDRTGKSKTQSTHYKNENEKQRLREYGGIEYRSIHQCLAAGLLANPARKDEPNFYRSTGNRKIMIFPGSGLFNKKAQFAKSKKQKQVIEEKVSSPDWILAGEIVETNRLYARTVAVIDPTWLVLMGEHILKYSYSQPSFETDKGRVVCRESIRIHGLELQCKTVSYLKVDPTRATEIFIREGLLNENVEISQNLNFLEVNRKLKNRIQNAQTITKIQSWIGIEEAAFQFYSSRLKNIASIGDLNGYLKINGSNRLEMTESDLTPQSEDTIDLSAFPESVEFGNTALPIEYNYQPGEKGDGVTLNIPYSKADNLNSPLLDWLVPGHLESKVYYLLKGLPKDLRRRLQPLAKTAKDISRSLVPNEQSLCECLSSHLSSSYGIETYYSDWKEDGIPEHLRVRIRVHDSKGETVLEDRSAESIRKKIRSRESSTTHHNSNRNTSLWEAALRKWSRTIESVDDLESQPEKRKIGEINGLPLFAYPTLRRQGDVVKLTLLKSFEESKTANSLGIEQLIKHELRKELAWTREDLKDFSKLGSTAISFAPLDKLKEQAYSHIEKHLCNHNINTISVADIKNKIESAKSQSRGLVYKLIDLLQKILITRQELKVKKDLPPDLDHEIDRLLPTDFLEKTPHWALNRLPIYLKSLLVRLQSRIRDPERDAARQGEIDRLRNQLAASKVGYSQYSDIAWSIEEYALSLFAQSLGTAFPVSEKRILQKLREPPESELSKPTNSATTSTKPNRTIDRPTSSDLESLKTRFGKH